MAAQKRRKGGSHADGGGGPIGGGGGGPIGGGTTARLIWLELAKKYKELSDLYKKLAKTPIGVGKPLGG